MKKIIFIIFSLSVLNPIWANETRMATLGLGDYLDDIININRYPSQIILYQNFLYGDIANQLEDYGIVLAPVSKFGALAIWQAGRFNVGYAVNIHKFDIGLSGSPTKNYEQIGVGISRRMFARRFDLGFRLNDSLYSISARYSQRKGDFILTPRYLFINHQDPYEYYEHRAGMLLQKVILNDGSVWVGAEYNRDKGDINLNKTFVYAGLELALSKMMVLRCGFIENFKDLFEESQFQFEPGIGINVREVRLDFYLNKLRLFDKDLTIFNSFGVELDFSKF